MPYLSDKCSVSLLYVCSFGSLTLDRWRQRSTLSFVPQGILPKIKYDSTLQRTSTLTQCSLSKLLTTSMNWQLQLIGWGLMWCLHFLLDPTSLIRVNLERNHGWESKGQDCDHNLWYGWQMVRSWKIGGAAGNRIKGLWLTMPELCY